MLHSLLNNLDQAFTDEELLEMSIQGVEHVVEKAESNDTVFKYTPQQLKAIKEMATLYKELLNESSEKMILVSRESIKNGGDDIAAIEEHYGTEWADKVRKLKEQLNIKS